VWILSSPKSWISVPSGVSISRGQIVAGSVLEAHVQGVEDSGPVKLGLAEIHVEALVERRVDDLKASGKALPRSGGQKVVDAEVFPEEVELEERLGAGDDPCSLRKYVGYASSIPKGEGDRVFFAGLEARTAHRDPDSPPWARVLRGDRLDEGGLLLQRDPHGRRVLRKAGRLDEKIALRSHHDGQDEALAIPVPAARLRVPGESRRRLVPPQVEG
jgi:hypothetical protein